MPPINREQVRILQQRGVINERTAALYLSRLNAGQTVDVPASIISQAVPERLPSPVGRALGGLDFASPFTQPSPIGILGRTTEDIPSIFDLFRGAENPAFQAAQAAQAATPLSAQELFVTEGADVQEPTGATPTPPPDAGGPDLTAAFGGAGGPVQLQSVLDPNGQPIPGMGIDPSTGQTVQFETAEQRVQRTATELQQRRAASPEARREQEFLERQRGITEREDIQRFQAEQAGITREFQAEQAAATQQAAIEAENRAILRQQLSQPGGEFLARAMRQRGQGLTPVFDPARDLRSLQPGRFEQLFAGARQTGSAIPSGGVAGVPAIQAALSNQSALERGGIGTTGSIDFATIPNIAQISGLTEAEFAELAAVLPQLTGQSGVDLQRQSRRLAPPSGASFTAAFR